MYMSESQLIEFLDRHGIDYQRSDHPPVFTCEEARRFVPPMEAAETKNVFVRDRKGHRHFLVVVNYEKSVDLKALSAILEVDRLVLASPERLLRYLGVEPGSVTILGLIHDRQREVQLIFDQDIAIAAALRCHPLINSATLAVPRPALDRFLKLTGHAVRTVDVPARS